MTTPDLDRIHLSPGRLIVFEGLDSTGKTTQLRRLQEITDPSATIFAHMPTGLSPLTQTVRALLEDDETRPQIDLAAQLLHLGCHAEAVPTLQAHLRERALVLDRWWWSTTAYGWFGGTVPETGLTRTTWDQLISSIWATLEPDVVFYFGHPHRGDANNRSGVAEGYEQLLFTTALPVVRIEATSEDEVARRIVQELVEREIGAHLPVRDR